MEVIEMTFEKIPISHLPNIINMLNNIESENVSISSSFKENISKDDVLNILSSNQYSLAYHYKNIYILGNNFKSCFIHIINYNYEIEINLQLNQSELKKIRLMNMINEASNFSNKLKAEKYCCGYEPATDEDTQFFSTNKVGPLSW